MAIVGGQPATLPIATRAWCRRDTPSISKPSRKSSRRPSKFIALDVIALGTDYIGCAVIGQTNDWRIEREVIFYPDALPVTGLTALRQFVQERTYRRGASSCKAGDAQPDLIWRDGTRLVVQLFPLSQFLKLFYRIAYEDRSLVIGDGLPAALARLAAQWHGVKKGDKIGVWRLTLWTYTHAETGRELPSIWRPYIDIKHVGPDINFIRFTGRRADKPGQHASFYSGEFLDVSNLARALTGRNWALAEACKAFTGEVLDARIENGRIEPATIVGCRVRVRAAVSLAETLLELFDRLHPVSRGAIRRRRGALSETRLYSPGGLARAYFSESGLVSPFVQQDRVGAASSASFGGWAGIAVRGRVPVIHLDFRRQYQTVFLLQQLQTPLTAECLEFVEETEAIRAFVERVTLDDLLCAETWPRLNALCWVRAAGQILPGRFAFNQRTGPDRFAMAVTERHGDEPVVLYLADVIASKSLSGRAGNHSRRTYSGNGTPTAAQDPRLRGRHL